MDTWTPTECDVVVIGAGISGLTAAALMAKAGMSVCVVEAQPRPGGYLAGFQRKKFRFDSAIHWLNQCGPGGFVHRVFDFIGPGAPEAPPQRGVRRLKGDSFDYTLTCEPDQLKAALLRDFPQEARGVERLFAAARELVGPLRAMENLSRSRDTMGLLERGRLGARTAKAGLPFVRYLTYSTERAFDSLLKAPTLKKVFCSEERLLSVLVPLAWAYMGDFQHPPNGGSQRYPEWLCAVLREWGATVAFLCPVTQVLVEGRRAVGVRIRHKQEEREIRARHVVAACDVETLYERMLPPGTIDASLLDKLRDAEIYDSSFTLSLGLDAPPEEIGDLGEAMVFLTRDDVGRAEHSRGDPERAAIWVLAPSVHDPTLAPAGKGTLAVFVTTNIRHGDHWKAERTADGGYVRGEAYKRYKRQYADIVLERVERALAPGLRDHVEVMDIATPVTHHRYTGNRDGSIMGARPGRKNIRAKIAHNVTPVDGLVLAGHWAEYGGGLPICVRAAANAALLVMQEERPEGFAALAALVDGRKSPDEAQGGTLKTLAAPPPVIPTPAVRAGLARGG